MSRLIVIKSHSHFQGNTGVVIPLIIEEDGHQPRAVHHDEFENGNKLFIADDYQVKIDEPYKEDELFVISSWNETDRDDWKTTTSKQRYISFGNLVGPLEKSSYLPIIDMEMPDVSTGTVDAIPSVSLTSSHFMIWRTLRSHRRQKSATRGQSRWDWAGALKARPASLLKCLARCFFAE